MLNRTYIAIALGVMLSCGATMLQAGTEMENQAPQNEMQLRNVTLTDPLTIIIDAAGDTIVLPALTVVGREQIEGAETKLRDVTLVQDLSFIDPSTGKTVILPTGTVIQRLQVEPNEFKLRAVEPDGTVVRIRNEAAETQEEAAEMEHEGKNHGPSATAGPGVNSGRDDAAGSSEHGGRDGLVASASHGDRGDVEDRSAAPDRPSSMGREGAGGGDRPERVERSGHSGRH